MIEYLLTLNNEVNRLVWGLPMIIVLIGIGLFITFRTGFIQFSRFGLMCRETKCKIFHRGPTADGDITPFQAVTVAMGRISGLKKGMLSYMPFPPRN